MPRKAAGPAFASQQANCSSVSTTGDVGEPSEGPHLPALLPIGVTRVLEPGRQVVHRKGWWFDARVNLASAFARRTCLSAAVAIPALDRGQQVSPPRLANRRSESFVGSVQFRGAS